MTGGKEEVGTGIGIKQALIYDTTTNEITQMNEMGQGRHLHSQTTLGNSVYVFCGRSSDNAQLKSIEHCKINNENPQPWTQFMPTD